MIPAEETEPGQQKQHDVEILASLPGVGRIVLATLLAEAFDASTPLRSLTGVAPVTKRSGKSCIVIRRQACSDRLSNAVITGCGWPCSATPGAEPNTLP